MIKYEMRQEKRKGNKGGSDVRDPQKNHTQVSSFQYGRNPAFVLKIKKDAFVWLPNDSDKTRQKDNKI